MFVKIKISQILKINILCAIKYSYNLSKFIINKSGKLI